MSNNNYKVCATKGCPNLTKERHCPKCSENAKKRLQEKKDQFRGTAAQRGYGAKWQKGRKPFFQNPDNQFCYIHGPKCLGLANVKEHIVPPSSPQDSLFRDPSNFGAACVPCNSWKNHRSIQQLLIDEKEYYKATGFDPVQELARRRYPNR